MDAELMGLMRVVAAGDEAAALRLLAESPRLATAGMQVGASRQGADGYFFPQIGRYAYAGHTALHVAAAAYQTKAVGVLIAAGADVAARNRRGAQPLHEAAVGTPDALEWAAAAQARTIAALIAAGADVNAADAGGATPLHRAVRSRCTAAVKALLDGGADASRANKTGSSPMALTNWTTGRGGSGSPAAKAELAEIVRLLEVHGAA
jgi:ankyrin repeat protein